jgi:hypothetical protein
MMRFVPGFVAAVIAFAVHKLFSLAAALSAQAVIFLLTYIVVTVLADFAMRRYGRPRQ